MAFRLIMRPLLFLLRDFLTASERSPGFFSRAADRKTGRLASGIREMKSRSRSLRPDSSAKIITGMPPKTFWIAKSPLRSSASSLVRTSASYPSTVFTPRIFRATSKRSASIFSRNNRIDSEFRMNLPAISSMTLNRLARSGAIPCMISTVRFSIAVREALLCVSYQAKNSS
ncbi:MAG: hypothetical protein BWY44_01005 [Candidatus Omnitrophica bacterium ADurb.Bin292]|nr:MAG: hypothetical protein BWY44_01005 [Candidatus Omnitrophica bacterium ADurb.Bin292]